MTPKQRIMLKTIQNGQTTRMFYNFRGPWFTYQSLVRNGYVKHIRTVLHGTRPEAIMQLTEKGRAAIQEMNR